MTESHHESEIPYSLEELRRRLDRISEAMLELIKTYGLDADSPFEVIAVARAKIIEPADYVRFLELSLEGRIYGDAAAKLLSCEADT